MLRWQSVLSIFAASLIVWLLLTCSGANESAHNKQSTGAPTVPQSTDSTACSQVLREKALLEAQLKQARAVQRRRQSTAFAATNSNQISSEDGRLIESSSANAALAVVDIAVTSAVRAALLHRLRDVHAVRREGGPNATLDGIKLRPFVALDELLHNLSTIVHHQGYAQRHSEARFAHGAAYSPDAFLDTLLSYVVALARNNAESRGLTPDGFVRGNRMQIYTRVVASPLVSAVCESGFNFGYSAMLFLASNPYVRVLSVDLFEDEWKLIGRDFVSLLFGERLTALKGNSSEQLRLFAERMPDHRCDLIHVDGGHEAPMPALDLDALLSMAHSRSVVLIDDVGTCEYCVAPQRALDAAIVEKRLEMVRCYLTMIEGELVDGRDSGHQFCLTYANVPPQLD